MHVLEEEQLQVLHTMRDEADILLLFTAAENLY